MGAVVGDVFGITLEFVCVFQFDFFTLVIGFYIDIIGQGLFNLVVGQIIDDI